MKTNTLNKIFSIFLSIIIFILIDILFPNSISAQNKNEALDQWFNYYHENGSFSGVVLAAENGKIIYRKAFGFSDFTNMELLEPSAVFNIASTTKPFTALAVMMLKERGKLSYEDKLIDFLPDFPSYGKEITIRHLLTHTSGVTDFVNEMHLHYRLSVLTTQSVYDSLKAQPSLNFESGTQYSYSNSGYFLLAIIIEKVSGKSYREFLETNIFNPLKMSNTYSYDETMAEIPKRVNAYVGYWKKCEDDLQFKVPGEGNIYSTVSDLFLFDQALCGSRLVQPETIREAFDTRNSVPVREGLKYGFGWHIKNDTSGTIVYHPGANGGFRCQFWRHLRKKQTLIVLSNNTFLSSCPRILSGAQKIMKGEPFAFGGIPITELFYISLKDHGFETAMKRIRETKDMINTRYSYPENDINNLGLEFLFFKNDPHHAVEIFKFNVELYPESWNAYDSLAEGYIRIGKDELALKAFEESLKLNPICFIRTSLPQ